MNTLKQEKLPLEFMLDTVVLKLKHPNFAVLDGHKFNPTFTASKEPHPAMNAYLGKYTQNPSKQEVQYYPRLTIYEYAENQQRTHYLHIELSLPKLLFGDNIQELDAKSFDTLAGLLSTRLRHMDVLVLKEILKSAIVVKAHFGKNIELPYPKTAHEAIAELYRADMGKRKEKTIKEYKNSGKILHFYSTSEGIAFYDKVADIEASKNRAFDKDKTKQEKLLLEELQQGQPREILRFEVRFSMNQTLKSQISKVLGKKIDKITFEKIFDEKLWKDILIAKWKEISDRPVNQLALKLETRPEEILKALIKQTGSGPHSFNQVIQGFGLYTITKQCDSAFIRKEVENNWNKKQYKRLLEKMGRVSSALKDISQSMIAQHIEKTLEEFKQYDLKIPG